MSYRTIIDYVDLLLPNLEYVRARVVEDPCRGLYFNSKRRYEWSESGYPNGDYAIEVVDKEGDIIAAFGWKVHKGFCSKRVDAAGTYVHEKHQRRGLAKAMWRAMIEREQPSRIEVGVVSDKGNTLATAMRDEYKHIDFRIKDWGDRKLRDLRKARKASAA